MATVFELNKQYWIDRWRAADTPWRHEGSDSDFITWYHAQRERPIFRTDAHCFVPLCGDSPVVRFLYDEGFSVTAVDIAAEAIESLRLSSFAEEFPSAGKSAYEAPSIQVRVQDIFQFSSEERFDFVYDRGGLVALDPGLRLRYLEVVFEHLRPGAYYFVATGYFPDLRKEPPFPVSIEELTELMSPLHLRETDSQIVQLQEGPLFAVGITSFERRWSLFQKPEHP